MFRCLSLFNLAIPLLSAGIEDDSVNLLQTTVKKHQISEEVAGTKKTCVIKGDPHMKLWHHSNADGAKANLYGTYADYWLVNAPKLKVMGRIGGAHGLDMGCTKGLAVTGPLMEDKVLIIPAMGDNNDQLTFDGNAITAFPWTSPGGSVTITYGKVPNWNKFGTGKDLGLRDDSYTVKMGDAAEIQLNNGVMQHLEISVDSDIVADDTGRCNHECKDWFKCPDPICDLSKSLFTWEHPECGHVIIRVPCNPLRHQLATTDCEHMFAGDPPGGVAIQNCIEDCCADRDQCPDRGKGNGFETCIIFGDPHIKSFDSTQAKISTYSPIGTHNLVKSKYVNIQANYVSDSKVKAQMEGIAITGAIVSNGTDGKHSVIYIPPKSKGGGVQIDGTNVMPCEDASTCSSSETFYEDPDKHFNISFGSGDEIPALLKEARPVRQEPNVHTIKFTEGATIRIHQGIGQSIFMSIDDRLLYGVSGECGNMNGNPDDDTHDPFDAQNGNCAPQSEWFIPDAAKCTVVPMKDCSKKKAYIPFFKQCMNHFGLQGNLKTVTAHERKLAKDCMKDCCYGGTCPDGTGDASDSDF